MLWQMQNRGKKNSETSVYVPTEYKLCDPYPNPFNSSVNITVELPTNSHIEIKLFNVLGRLVQNVHVGKLKTGVHNFHVHGENLASGVYFITMEAKNFTATKKLVLLK